MALQYLLGDLDAQIFASNCWDKVPLHIDRDVSSYYDDILTFSQALAYLHRQDLRIGAIKLFSESKELDPHEYIFTVSEGRFSGEKLIDSAAVFSNFEDGTVVAVGSPEYGFSSLAAWLPELERNLGFRVDATAYMYPARSVFSLNRLSYNTLILALDGETTLQTATETFHLLPGDLLYLPREYTAKTLNGSRTSLCLVISLIAPTWREMLAELLNEVSRDADFRQSAPLPFKNNSHELVALKRKLTHVARFENQQHSMQHKFRPGKTSNHSGKLMDHLALPNISTETTFSARAFGNARLSMVDNHITLHAHDKVLSFSASVKDLLMQILELKQFKLRDLGQEVANDVKLDLARRLVREGLLKILQ